MMIEFKMRMMIDDQKDVQNHLKLKKRSALVDTISNRPEVPLVNSKFLAFSSTSHLAIKQNNIWTISNQRYQIKYFAILSSWICILYLYFLFCILYFMILHLRFVFASLRLAPIDCCTMSCIQVYNHHIVCLYSQTNTCVYEQIQTHTNTCAFMYGPTIAFQEASPRWFFINMDFPGFKFKSSSKSRRRVRVVDLHKL